MERTNPSGKFESKPAPEIIRGKNSTASFSSGPEEGAGEVGNNEPNPFGPDNKQKGY